MCFFPSNCWFGVLLSCPYICKCPVFFCSPFSQLYFKKEFLVVLLRLNQLTLKVSFYSTWTKLSLYL